MIEFADDAQDLIEGYRRFRKNRYAETADVFRKLNQGQTPATMIISCADSRADPAMIFDGAPGELFVVRNVAALVPPYEETAGLHGVSAALEFAVTALKVRQILVMGHGGCGGIDACIKAATEGPVGHFIAPWVELAAPARSQVFADPNIPPEGRQEALEHAAVLQSLENLKTFGFVRDAMSKGDLVMHGAWFSIGKGELHWHDPETGNFDIVPAD